MADYVTQATLEAFIGAKLLVQLTDEGGTGTVQTGPLMACISAGEGDINARLYKGFQGPITVAQHGQRAYDIASGLAHRTTRYHLFSRRPHLLDQNSWIVADYHAALDSATALAKGAQALAGDPPVPRTSPEAPAAASGNVNNRPSSTRPTSRNWTRESQGNA